VTVNLATTAAQLISVFSGTDTLSGIENVIGSALFNDTIDGNSAANNLNGLGGDDVIKGWSGNDTIFGGLGNDNLGGGDGDDWIDGGDGNDTLKGNVGNDTLQGGLGNDILGGGDGNDWIDGGAGDDLFTFNQSGDDVMIGGVGTDTVDYSNSTDGVTVNLATTAAQLISVFSGTDTLSGIENVIGSAYNDRLAGNNQANVLTGAGGVDHFVFKTALSGSNADTITDFLSGNDVIELSAAIFNAFAGQVGNTVGLGVNLSYDAGLGVVSYDADGAGAGNPVALVVLGELSHPASLGNDFLIIA